MKRGCERGRKEKVFSGISPFPGFKARSPGELTLLKVYSFKCGLGGPKREDGATHSNMGRGVIARGTTPLG